jgi:signal transduction histidine kinase/ligand-binding sensor domain-containing protein
MVTVVVAALLAAFDASASAADLTHVLVGYTFTSWSSRNGLPVRNGLPSRYIWALAQDREGYVWLGTDTGLVRFDGERFLPWEAFGSTSLTTAPVRSLCVSRDGSLWIGFGDRRGISRIRHGQAQHYDENHGLAQGATMTLVEDQTGAIWAGGTSGLHRLAGDRWQRFGSAEGLSDATVNSAYVDRRGTLFIGTSSRIFRRDQDQSRFHEVEAPGHTVAAIIGDRSGGVWVTDPTVGFRRLGKSQGVSHVLEGGSGNQLLSDRAGNLWVGTAGQGLWRVSRESAGDAVKVERATTLTGLLTDGVISLLEDRDGNIWVGTTEGLNRLTPYKLTPINLGLTNGVEETADGHVWVGTVSGLIRFPQGRAGSPQKQVPVPAARVSAMHADRSGTMWIATNRGLLRLVAGRPSRVVIRSGDPPHQIAAITSDARGDVWLYDLKQGLLRFNRGALTAVTLPPEMSRTSIISMYTDRSDRIWMGLADGQLAVLDRHDGIRMYGPPDGLDAGPYQAIYEDMDGAIWLGGGTGLSRLSNGQFATLRRGNDFPAETITAIVEDEARVLWLGTSSGIVRIDEGEFTKAVADGSYQPHYGLYDRSDGLGGMPVTVGVNQRALRAKDGRLWFVTRRGITLVDPTTVVDKRGPAPVHIESIVADGQQLTALAGATLPPRTTRLAIDYGVLNLASQLNTRFRYRLEGFDTGWTDAGSQRQAVYTNLPPRRYRFRVMANNDQGTWAAPGAAWDFSISPMFYQTAWFFAACVGALVLTIWGAWGFHLRQVRKEFAVLLKERARLSREIHDTLLQSLVGVALQCEAISGDLDSPARVSKERFVRMRKQVEEHIREARQSIWDLRSPKLESRDLAGALREAGERAIAGQDLAFQFTVIGEQHTCAAKVEEQLLRIGQEAVVNAIRHAQAHHLWMDLQYDAASVALRVSDDGCGFDPERLVREANGHYGLISMRERAADLGGRFTIASVIGSGTRIETVVPTSRNP